MTHGAVPSVGFLLPQAGPGIGAEEGLGLWSLVSLSSPEVSSQSFLSVG